MVNVAWKELATVLALACICIAIEMILLPPVQASDSIGDVIVSTVHDFISGTNQTAENRPIGPTPYVQQGDTVYIGDYIDVSGVVPPYPQLAYWDGFDMYDSPPKYNITMPDGKKGYYQFYLDPAIFNGRTGRWYKYGGDYERQGNNLAFVVKYKLASNISLTYPNGTIINISAPNSPYAPKVIAPAPLLEERHLADYILARGDDLVLPNGSYHTWIFGRLYGIYDTDNKTIKADVIQNKLENGNYNLVTNLPGSNTIVEAKMVGDNLTPGLYGKQSVNTRGMAAPVVYEKFKDMLKGTDDQMFEHTLVLDDPYITINQADEIQKAGVDFLDVRGYSNVANGTAITVTLDEKTTYYKDILSHTSKTIAIRTSPGNLSYYRAYVPVDYENLAADARNHTLIARTALGGESQKDFKISVMPADSYKPNATLKYIEDRNPFIPTPTPEKVQVIVTVPVTVTVTIPVTPSDQQVYTQQKVVENDRWNANVQTVFNILGIIGGLTVVVGAVWYGRRVYCKVRRQKEKEREWHG